MRPGCLTPDDAFDIVFNGVSLMHIIDYQAAIREAARVAGRYCVLHRAGVRRSSNHLSEATVPMVRPSSRSCSASTRIDVALPGRRPSPARERPCIPYDVSEVTGHRSTTETYLFSKDTTR